MTAAWDLTCPTHTAKLVLMALADNASDEGYCWPSLTTLAVKCDLSRQGIIDQIDILERMGVVETIRTSGKPNRYRVQPVSGADQSRTLTSQPGGPVVVNVADRHQSTGLTGPVNGVDPNHKEPSSEPSGEPSSSRALAKAAQFEAFWNAYPRKIGKGAAEKAFKKAIFNRIEDLLEAIERQKKTAQWKKENGQFIPHPATWLNQKRWLDEAPADAGFKPARTREDIL